MLVLYLLIGVGLLFVAWTVLRAIANASPRRLAMGAKVGAGIGGGLLAVWLLLASPLARMLLIPGLLGPGLRWLQRWMAGLNGASRPAGQSSTVETAFLRMSLDHDSGALDGVVLQGLHAGRRLAELTARQLLDLLAEVRVHDGEGADILEAYLDRVHPDWRRDDGGSQAAHAPPAGESASMSREEAYRVLGLEPGADERAVREAHRRLMVRLHPDQGGTNYLAAKINQAKDILLGH